MEKIGYIYEVLERVKGGELDAETALDLIRRILVEDVGEFAA